MLRGVILLHDNASPHRRQDVVNKLIAWDWEIMPHPAYSPDLSPCDNFLFPKLKKPLLGHRSHKEEEIISAVTASVTVKP